MATRKEVRFILDIPADQYLRYYRGSAGFVQARTVDGKLVKFPANILRRYVSHGGVRGEFLLQYDENGTFVSMRRLGRQPGSDRR